LDTEQKICKIGQSDRCCSTGCEWEKSFGHNCCENKKVEIAILEWEKKSGYSYSKEEKKVLKSKPIVPVIIQNKKGRFVKDEKKYTEIKKVYKKIYPEVKVKKELYFNKIKVAEQDDFISKIKTL
jgi:hypothetical protein